MTKKLTDEQRQLVTDNHNLIYGFLNKYHLPDYDWYDVAAIGLVNAAMTYNGSTAFSTYAYKCMFNEMRNELIYRDRHQKEDLSLDYEYSNDKGESYTMADMIVADSDFTEMINANHDIRKLVTFLGSRLRNDSQRKQFKLLCRGVPPMEIAKMCGVSRQQVYLLRKNLLEEYKQIFNTNGTVRRAEVGGKIRIANNPYLFDVVARDNRYIICTRKYNTSDHLNHIIIDLKRRVYGQEEPRSWQYDTKEMCERKLRQLQDGSISILLSTEKNLDFFVAQLKLKDIGVEKYASIYE